MEFTLSVSKGRKSAYCYEEKGQPIDVTIAGAVEEPYSYTHLGIAVANDVLTKIEELMGWPK